MKIIIQFKKKKDPIQELEHYFHGLKKGFNRQISNLNAEGYFQNSRKRFYDFLHATNKRIKKEEKKLLKHAWVKDLKRGKFLSKRAKTLKHWYDDNSSVVYKTADQGFNKVEETLESSLFQSRDWVVQKAPELGQKVKKYYKTLSSEVEKSSSDYLKFIKRPKFKSDVLFTIESVIL